MKLEQVNNILLQISTYVVVVPIILSLFKLRAFNLPLKALFIYLCGALAFEHFYDYIPGALFTLFEYLIISFLFIREFHNKTLSLFLKIVAGIFAAFTAFELTLYPHEDFLLMIEYSMVIAFSLLFFYQMLTSLKVPKLTDYHFFYFAIAFLIYFSGSFFIFLFSKEVTQFDKTIAYSIGIFHSLLNSFYFMCIAFGIWKINKK